MDEYGVAYQEVFEIISQMEEKYLEMIPNEIWNQIKEKRDKNHKLNCDLNYGIEYKNLNKMTWEILSYLDYNYWSSKENKKILEKAYAKNESIAQLEKMKKYKSDFMNKKETN